jgi:hypothetical protein
MFLRTMAWRSSELSDGGMVLPCQVFDSVIEVVSTLIDPICEEGP